MSKRICETCKFEHFGLFEEPCVSCLIENNSNWIYQSDTIKDLEELINAKKEIN